MGGRGRVFDNIFIERIWRSLKYEKVYLKNRDKIWQLKGRRPKLERFDFVLTMWESLG